LETNLSISLNKALGKSLSFTGREVWRRQSLDHRSYSGAGVAERRGVAALDFVDICPNLKRRLSLIECAEQRETNSRRRKRP
jgi:hypothetical protein